MNKINLTILQCKDLVLDISELVGKEVLYVNATKLAKQFNKRVDDFLRLDETNKCFKVLTTSQVGELKIIAVKEFCNDAQMQREKKKGKYPNGKCPYYIKLTNLVYKSLGLKKPKGAHNTRNIFNGATVERIESLEEVLLNLIIDFLSKEIKYHEAYKKIQEKIIYVVNFLTDKPSTEVVGNNEAQRGH